MASQTRTRFIRVSESSSNSVQAGYPDKGCPAFWRYTGLQQAAYLVFCKYQIGYFWHVPTTTNQFFDTLTMQVSSWIAARLAVLVEFAVFLISSTISNRQVDTHIYLPFYFWSAPRRIELCAGRERKENASVTQSGTCFPNGGPGGKFIPESALRTGRAFPAAVQAESASRNLASNWDTLSASLAASKNLRSRHPKTG